MVKHLEDKPIQERQMPFETEWNVREHLLEEAGTKILEAIPKEFYDEEHMKDTPKRFARSMMEFLAGYRTDPEKLMKVFPGRRADSIIVLRDVEFYSMCPHHLVPIQGKADVGYLTGTDGVILGLSKMARLVDWATRRLVTQEEATEMIASTLFDQKFALKPRGVGVRMRAKHFCMCSRGVMKQESYAITSALLGEFLDIVKRDEWLNLLRD